METSESLRQLIEQVVNEALEAHVPALREELVNRAADKLRPLLEEVESAAAIKASQAAPHAASQEPTPAGGAPTDLLNAALASVQDSNSQAEILSTLLDGCTKFCERAALFVVRSGNASGWRGRGFADDIKSVPLDMNGQLVSRVMRDRQPVSAASAEFDSGFIGRFGAPAEGTNVLLLPLVIRDKVVAMMYADPGSGPGRFDSSALECLVRATGLWLEVVSGRKSGTTVAQEMSAAPPAEAPGAYEAPPRQAAAAVAPETAPPPAPEPPPPPPVATQQPPPPPSTFMPVAATPSTPEEEEVHKKAKRFAKLLVDEIKLYNQQKVSEGRQHHDLYTRLKDDIEKSRATYDKRYGQTAAAPADYFKQELVRILANNDASLLGGEFPS